MGEFLFEVLGEIVDETAVALGLKRPPRDAAERRLHPAIATIGYAAIGVFVGVMSVLVWRRGSVPDRFAVPASIAAAALGGLTTLSPGLWLRMNGHKRRTTSFMTFWSGAAFALGIALARFALAR